MALKNSMLGRRFQPVGSACRADFLGITSCFLLGPFNTFCPESFGRGPLLRLSRNGKSRTFLDVVERLWWNVLHHEQPVPMCEEAMPIAMSDDPISKVLGIARQLGELFGVLC